jgi:Fe-Mn family superoxide dismutase
LPALPFAPTDLEPYYSEQILALHHGKHHQAYVTNINNLLKNSDLTNLNLEELIKVTVKDASKVALFNNAAQIWNHTFFWHSIKKDGGGTPGAALLKKIGEDFGSFDKFKEEFTEKATKIFGSGWCWVVAGADGKLKIVQTSNAATPITDNLKPILTLDVWEHAYYPDYQNRRPEFIGKFLDHLVNWDFAEEMLASK